MTIGKLSSERLAAKYIVTCISLNQTNSQPSCSAFDTCMRNEKCLVCVFNQGFVHTNKQTSFKRAASGFDTCIPMQQFVNSVNFPERLKADTGDLFSCTFQFPTIPSRFNEVLLA